MLGVCKYCGQARDGFWGSEQEANISVTRNCDCPEATRQRIIKNCRDYVYSEFRDEIAETPHRGSLLFGCMINVALQEVKQCTVKLTNGRTVKFSPTTSAPGGVRVSVTNTQKAEEDIIPNEAAIGSV